MWVECRWDSFIRDTDVVSRDSSVYIASRYRQDGPGIESRWGRDLDYPGAHPASYSMGTWSFPRGRGLKRPGRGVDHPHPSNAEVKERVDLYL